jgi:mRNA interferase RelE/StbE
MYEIVISKAADKQLKSIPKKDQLAILRAIEALGTDPTPTGVKALQGNLTSYYRVRCGDYRIIYSIENKKLILVVVKIGHRRDIYR